MDIATIVIAGIFVLLILDQLLNERKHNRRGSNEIKKSVLREESTIDYNLHEKSHSKYCVYHIKNGNHSYLLGYIGVSNNFDARKQQHILHLKNKCHINYKLQKAWNDGAFNEDSIQILYADLSKADAYNREFNLRNRMNIGWNINKGGYS